MYLIENKRPRVIFKDKLRLQPRIADINERIKNDTSMARGEHMLNTCWFSYLTGSCDNRYRNIFTVERASLQGSVFYTSYHLS